MSEIKNIFIKIRWYLNKGNNRSKQLKKSLVSCLIIKIISVAISLLMIPMCINYINAEQYGIWLTLSTIVLWLGFFDIGLANGLRNKFAEAKAKGDTRLAKEYVSTTFFILSLIFGATWVIFMVLNRYIDWNVFFHISIKGTELNSLFSIIITYFCLQNIFKILSTVLLADQKPGWSSFFDMLGQLFALIIIWVMMQLIPGSLLKLGITLCFVPLVVWVIANFFFFKGSYKAYSPSIKSINKARIKDILNLGVKFFIIQIACVIQFQTANFIIAHFFSAVEVTNYNIVYKYFNVLAMTFTIFLSPFWSAITDAWTLKDMSWIKNTTQKYVIIATAFNICGLIMLIVAPVVIRFWVGKEIAGNIDNILLVLCYIYVAITLYTTLFVNILNGMGILRTQYILALISPIIYIAITYIFIDKFNLGTYSIYIALIASNINGFIAPFQYYKLIRKHHIKTNVNNVCIQN
ncbi:lipopolysaccharide biosynthesis protein [Coprobacter tertius]|uniref:Polysaccharide biosynthesis protein n=1 Tax=Coprobacter tertius TaxID=2944915 RepID=A0ABT1MJR2_9BACT|nr:oligosaccharide flippase family protein [Coprobacter tertius]MCP9612860.1 hypothetical protein [Coprobacter tertius]